MDPPPAYFDFAYRIVRADRGPCLSDEVQTGFSRFVAEFRGFEADGVAADILTTAKGVGNGARPGPGPARHEIGVGMTKKLHFNTFAGNPWR